MKFYKASDVTVLVEALTLAKNAFEKNWAINWNELDTALEAFAAIAPVEVPKIDPLSSEAFGKAEYGEHDFLGSQEDCFEGGVYWENDRIRKIMEGGK